jgi:hypothetical protein
MPRTRESDKRLDVLEPASGRRPGLYSFEPLLALIRD